MHLSVAVISHSILLQTVSDGVVVDHHRRSIRRGLLYKIENVEEFAGISSGEAEKRLDGAHLYLTLREDRVAAYRHVEEPLQIRGLKRTKSVDLRAREERTDHLERGILGSGSDEGHHALLHSP